MTDQVVINIEEDDDDISKANIKKYAFTDEYDLPDTVTRLRLYHCNVYIVGTAHFSLSSIDDVAKTIELVRPRVVILELCKARQHILQMDQQKVIKDFEKLSMKKMIQLLKQNGLLQGLLQLLMIYMSSNLSKQLDMAPGGEFKMAYEKAEALNNSCRIILGDRDISITFQRALHSLSFYQKIKFAINILFESETITKEDVEKSKNKDMLEDMMQEMSNEFPSLARVFIDERDRFLKHSMAYGASQASYCLRHRNNHDADGRKASLPATMVAVVGIGHVKGIAKYWETEINQESLMSVPVGPSKGMIILKWTIRLSTLVTLGGIGYLVYRRYKS